MELVPSQKLKLAPTNAHWLIRVQHYNAFPWQHMHDYVTRKLKIHAHNWDRRRYVWKRRVKVDTMAERGTASSWKTQRRQCQSAAQMQSSQTPWAFSVSKSESSSPLELPEAVLSFSLPLWTLCSSSLGTSLGSGPGWTGAEELDVVGRLEELPRWVVGENSLALLISCGS